MPIGTPPPEPDLIAPRGTDQWRDAVHAKKQWIAMNLSRGVPLDDLVEKYGEGGSSREGRLSHDYEYWQKALNGESLGDEGLPSELGEANWNIGNFRRQANQGDFTEWPPGSGIYFNDPANDKNARQYFNQYGDRVAPGDAQFDIPDIDYNAVNSDFGGSIRSYLDSEKRHQEAAKHAKPVTGPDMRANPTVQAVQPNGSAQQAQQINSQLNQNNANGGIPTYGAWGISNFGSRNNRGNAQPPMQNNIQQARPFQGPQQNVNPFQLNQSKNGVYRPSSQGYQSWKM